MKNLLIYFVLIFVSGTAYSQIAFKTGSAELDADLNIINSSAKSNLSGFKTDMTVSFGVSVKKIDHMLSLNMAPGEVYISLEIARITKRPVDDVITVYKSNKSKGWGYIAQQMGIKPGSQEFHALKGNSKNKGMKMKGNKGKGKGRGN